MASASLVATLTLSAATEIAGSSASQRLITGAPTATLLLELEQTSAITVWVPEIWFAGDHAAVLYVDQSSEQVSAPNTVENDDGL